MQVTNATYLGANTRISGDNSRSGCVWVRASSANTDDIIFSVGSASRSPAGCNQQFSLAMFNSSHVRVYGMCPAYDNLNIYVGSNTMHDGDFHQICITYDTSSADLCIYLDLLTPQCITRTNPRYNTSTGDVRIGWWPEPNRGFVGTSGERITQLNLFDYAVNQSCVNYLHQSQLII